MVFCWFWVRGALGRVGFGLGFFVVLGGWVCEGLFGFVGLGRVFCLFVLKAAVATVSQFRHKTRMTIGEIQLFFN